MQSPPFPRYLVPLRSKYSPQHHILKHPQLPLLPQFQQQLLKKNCVVELLVKVYLYTLELVGLL